MLETCHSSGQHLFQLDDDRCLLGSVLAHRRKALLNKSNVRKKRYVIPVCTTVSLRFSYQARHEKLIEKLVGHSVSVQAESVRCYYADAWSQLYHSLSCYPVG